jgi:hypothetical protein
LRAAPRPTGRESATPSTVETTVIVRLSIMPSWISAQREVKSGLPKAATKAQPRTSPSATRPQFTCSVPSASAR